MWVGAPWASPPQLVLPQSQLLWAGERRIFPHPSPFLGSSPASLWPSEFPSPGHSGDRLPLHWSLSPAPAPPSMAGLSPLISACPRRSIHRHGAHRGGDCTLRHELREQDPGAAVCPLRGPTPPSSPVVSRKPLIWEVQPGKQTDPAPPALSLNALTSYGAGSYLEVALAGEPQ